MTDKEKLDWCSWRIADLERKLLEATNRKIAGYLFQDDPKLFALPGSGFSKTYPEHAVNITPVYY